MINKIKIKDLISYLFSSDDEIPEKFIFQEKEIKKIIFYLFEYIWYYPKMINYFQKYNFLYNQEIENNPLEFLKFFKQVLRENQISRHHFKSIFSDPQKFKKAKDIENEAIRQKHQVIDIITELKLAKIKNKNLKFNKIERIKINENIKEKISIAQNIIQKKIQKQTEKRKKVLKKLDENIINELQLTLIDVFIDEKHNQFVYLFIDKDFKKCYYFEPFEFNFYISKESGIINNDYLEKYNPKKFIKYTIYNFWNYNKLKKAINNNYKKFMTQL